MGIGLAAGMVLGMALALAREYMSDVVRGAADVEREPGLPYLGTLRVEGP
jgi:capsular polysaccharide biosynthesis protein